MEQKGNRISLYIVHRELSQVGTRCFAYSEDSGQVFLLSGYNAHRESEPNLGADRESLGFRRLWSCFLELKSLLFIPAVLRRTKREL